MDPEYNVKNVGNDARKKLLTRISMPIKNKDIWGNIKGCFSGRRKMTLVAEFNTKKERNSHRNGKYVGKSKCLLSVQSEDIVLLIKNIYSIPEILNGILNWIGGKWC